MLSRMISLGSECCCQRWEEERLQISIVLNRMIIQERQIYSRKIGMVVKVLQINWQLGNRFMYSLNRVFVVLNSIVVNMLFIRVWCIGIWVFGIVEQSRVKVVMLNVSGISFSSVFVFGNVFGLWSSDSEVMQVVMVKLVFSNNGFRLRIVQQRRNCLILWCGW